MGANVRTFNIGDINETTVYSPDGTGQVFTPNFSIIGATASKKLSDNTSVGLNANYIRESFGRVAASGMAFDLGVQYKGLASMEGLDVGFVLRNFGQPVKYDGEGLGVQATADDGDGRGTAVTSGQPATRFEIVSGRRHTHGGRIRGVESGHPRHLASVL